MKTPVHCLAVICLLLGNSYCLAGDRSSADTPVEKLREATVAFLESLNPKLRAQATFSTDDDERRSWSNLPHPMFQRQGVSFGEMSPDQRIQAHSLLQSALSSQGYMKATGIMQLDEFLKDLLKLPADSPVQLGHDLYWISVFGDPANDSVWGWQLDGHHLALNLAVVGDDVSVRPAFIGASPTTYTDGVFTGWNILFSEDETGKLLIASLDEAQLAKAIISAKSPEDLIAGPGKGDRLKVREGLPAAEMTRSQQHLLKRVIEEHVHNYRHDIAHEQMHRIMKDGFDEIYFAWAGTVEAEPYYYRVHGPAVIIEFTNMYQPNETSGPVNHIHTVFREPGNDYAEDFLKKHLEEHSHHRASAD